MEYPSIPNSASGLSCRTVFISNSRKHKDFVHKLGDSLAGQSREAWVELEGHSADGGVVSKDEMEVASAATGTAGAKATAAPAGKLSATKRNKAARVFGYDVFISFALGPPPRGSHSYASDLARRLRERDFTVFFSEDEAAPGEELDSTLVKALHRSRTLVVIANRSTLNSLAGCAKKSKNSKAVTPKD